MDPSFDHAAEDLWVFGYGSLIWRPGFEYVERVPAHIIGMHRSLCVYSFDHRGTPERPGLVLGLDFGGACRGIAYRVAAKHRAATLAYLRGREQTTAVYRELVRGVWLDGTAGAARRGAVLRGRPRPSAIRRASDARPATAHRAPGPRPIRQQPRLCDRNGESARSARHRRHDLHILAERFKVRKDSVAPRA